MKYLAILITGLLFGQTEIPVKIYKFPFPEVLKATKEVLKDMAIPIKDIEQETKVTEKDLTIIITETIETDVETINGYIKEERPVEKHGWERGRYSFVITLKKLPRNRTRVKIETKLERFGVPSELLLIPPAWTQAQSNSVLEEKIFSAIKNKMPSSGKRGKDEK